jgi:hypothetical protein
MITIHMPVWIAMRALIGITLLTLCGCVTPLPEDYAKSLQKSLVKGNKVGNVSTLIRNVDKSDPLFRRGYNLGNKVWLKPGTHTVSVTCIENNSWGQIIKSKNVQVNIKEGYTYELASSYFDGETPYVYLTALPSRGIFDPEQEFPSIEFEQVMNDFIFAAKSSNIEKMIELTSEVTLFKDGREFIQNLYETDFSPFLFQSKKSHDFKTKEFVSSKISKTGSGWIFYKKFDQPDGDFHQVKIIVLKENGRIVVTSFGAP